MRPVRETIHWCVDGQEVPADKDWTASMVAPGGYGAGRITIPVKYTRGVGQGAPVKAFRSNGKVLYYGNAVTNPKIRDGKATIILQGPSVRLQKTRTAFLFQSRDYGLYAARDAEPFNLQPNSEGISISNDKGYLEFAVDKGQDINEFALAGFAVWPQDTVNRIAFRIDVIAGNSSVHESYKLRLATYTGPNTQLDAAAADFNVNDGAEVDFHIPGDCDMITLSLRRVGGDTGSATQIKVRVQQLRINGRVLSDIMFAKEGIEQVATYVGWDRGMISPSGINALPVFWPASSDQGLFGLCTQLQTYDDYRWLALEPNNYSKAYATLAYGPWGDGRRLWHVKAEQGVADDFDETELYNRVLVPYLTLTGAPASTLFILSPDPLAFTAKWNNGVPMINTYAADEIPDRQPGPALSFDIGRVLSKQVKQVQLIGGMDVYMASGETGDVSRYELRAGDLLQYDDYKPKAGPQRIVQVDYDELKSRVTLTQQIGVAGLLAHAANRRARQKG